MSGAVPPAEGAPVAPPVVLPPAPVGESPAAFHRLYRAQPTYRWWRPLVAVVLFGVFAGIVLLSLNVVWFVFAVVTRQLSPEDFAHPDFEAQTVELLSDITNPSSLVVLLGSLAVLLPLVPLALLCAGIRPVSVRHSVAYRVRWDWMLRCALPALVVTLVSVALPWVLAFFTGETIRPVEVDPANFVVLAIIIVLLVPVQAAAEEYVFRGLLLQVIGAWVRWWPLAVVIATVLFTIGHSQYDIWGQLSVGVMGLGFAIVTLRTGGLEAAIALHVINNILAFLVLASGISGTTQMGGDSGGPIAPVIQLVFTVAYVWWVDRLAARHGIAREYRAVPIG